MAGSLFKMSGKKMTGGGLIWDSASATTAKIQTEFRNIVTEWRAVIDNNKLSPVKQADLIVFLLPK